MGFYCSCCNVEFKTKFSLKRHIQRVSSRNTEKKYKIICPYCRLLLFNYASLDEHIERCHDININVHELNFSSFEDFKSWKESEESITKAEFVTTSSYRQKNGNLVKCYVCSRSGMYVCKSSQPRKRMARSKGSRKTGVACPARMTVTFNNENVWVKYINCHGPHEKRFCYLSLPRNQEEEIAEKLISGVTQNHIIDEIRDTEDVTNGNLSKKHFVTKKELYNIMQKFGIPNEQYHNNDEISVELLVKQCAKKAKNPILMYKRQGEEHDEIDTNEMFLVIMTKAQKTMLEKFSANHVCIDSTHNTNKYEYQLTTLEVIDEFGEGFPCAFCISSKVNEDTMKMFFKLLKLEFGVPIHTSLFMSDDAPCYYNAWKAEMTEVEHYLICKWHIDRSFRKNLLRIPGNSQRKNEVYKSIRLLLEEPDKGEFNSLLQAFLERLLQFGYHDFYSYFSSHYANRPEVWASCYRTETHLNMNMVLEAFHKVLERTYLQAQKSERLDKLLLGLFKIARDKSFQRLIKLEEGPMNGYIEKINKRHRLADRVKNICFTNEEWHVSSSSVRNLVYIVKRQFDNESYVCECKTKCSQCETCIHEFSCNCRDYVISNNLCKHIHAAVNYCQNQAKDESISSSESVIVEPTNILMEVDINSFDANSSDILPDNISTCVLEEDDCIVTPKFEILMNKFDQLHHILQNKGPMLDEKIIIELDETIDKALKTVLSDELNVREDNSSEPINEKMLKQFRFCSVTKKSTSKTSGLLQKSETFEESQQLEQCILSDDLILNIHTNFDHYY